MCHFFEIMLGAAPLKHGVFALLDRVLLTSSDLQRCSWALCNFYLHPDSQTSSHFTGV